MGHSSVVQRLLEIEIARKERELANATRLVNRMEESIKQSSRQT